MRIGSYRIETQEYPPGRWQVMRGSQIYVIGCRDQAEAKRYHSYETGAASWAPLKQEID